jgi:endonuclease/exonuclease/phosphatase family metal-dependent hydrolase
LVVVTLDGARQTPALSLGAAAVGFTFLEILRVWFPSVLFVLGDAGGTPAIQMAAFGLACLGVAPVLATLIGRVAPVAFWRIGAAVLVIGRALLILDLAGPARLIVTSLAVLGATLATVALAAGGRADRSVRTGLLAGVVAATCLHAATRTLGLVWPQTIATTAVSLAVVAAIAIVLVRADRELAAEGDGRSLTSEGAAWPWLALTPMFVLLGIVSGVPGRTAVATGWSAPTVAATVAAAHLGALVAAVVARRLGPVRSGMMAAAAIAGGTAAALDASGWTGVLGQITLCVGIGLLVGSDLGSTLRPATARRRGVTAGLAVLGFGALSAAYYTAYDVALPLNNRVLLLATALFGATLGIASIRLGREATLRGTLDPGRFLRLLAVAGVTVALVAVIARPPGTPIPEPADPEQIRVATYNVRFGFDLDGRFAAREQGRFLHDLAPDIVLLNEVDRGWFASGGHDALEVIMAEVGLPYMLFSPAADEVWGNVLLSRYPIAESAVEGLPAGSDPMVRSQLAAVLRLDDERQLGIVGTHLSHLDEQGDTRLPQARAVAATVAVLRERQVPTIVLGDLNAPSGSAELATFDALVETLLPEGTLTYPSDEPTVHLDHILASSDLRPTEVLLPEVTLSDHRPVIIDLRLDELP